MPACNLVPTTFAQATAQAPAAKPAEPSWVQLLNGKDLTGWVKVGQEQWTVEDGAIYGVGVTKEYGYLRTEQKYIDFNLTLRFKVEADGNSGVFFHSDFPPGSVDISQGLQFEIDRVLEPPYRRHLRRRSPVDRLAGTGARNRNPADGLERNADAGSSAGATRRG